MTVMHNRLGQRQHLSFRQRGIAAVEMAIVTPLLVLLMLVIGEFGHALYQYNTLTKITRDGAQYLAVRALSSTPFIDVTRNNLDTGNPLNQDVQDIVVYGQIPASVTPLLPGLSAADVIVEGTGGCQVCPIAVNHVVVTTNYAYVSVFGATLPMLGFGPDISLIFTMTSSVPMRAL